MKGVCGFSGDGAAAGSKSTATEVVEKDYVGLSESATSYTDTLKDASGGMVAEEEERRGDEGAEEELELGLSLGAKKTTGCGGSRASPWGEYCRILTAKDFPSLGSRASPRSSSTSSVSSSSPTLGGGAGTKRAADSVASDVGASTSPPSHVVAVGWPPIRAFRMNTLVNQFRDGFSDSDTTVHKNNSSNNNNNNEEAIGSKDQEKKEGHVGSSSFVKVKMDGDPIGRKVDLNAHHSYETLALALEIMFHKPTMAPGSSTHGAKASKLLDGSSEFALTYEDKDGDWMLVGDVPWGMFLDTVKRLRIMRTSDANGLAPRFQLSKSAGLIRSKPAPA